MSVCSSSSFSASAVSSAKVSIVRREERSWEESFTVDMSCVVSFLVEDAVSANVLGVLPVSMHLTK